MNQITGVIVDTAFEVHQRLGPGMLESVYALVLAHRLEQRGLCVERNKSIPLDIDGLLSTTHSASISSSKGVSSWS